MADLLVAGHRRGENHLAIGVDIGAKPTATEDRSIRQGKRCIPGWSKTDSVHVGVRRQIATLHRQSYSGFGPEGSFQEVECWRSGFAELASIDRPTFVWIENGEIGRCSNLPVALAHCGARAPGCSSSVGQDRDSVRRPARTSASIIGSPNSSPLSPNAAV